MRVFTSLNGSSGAPETPKNKGGRPPSRKRPRPEVAEGFEKRGYLSQQAIGVLKALKLEVNPLTGKPYSVRDAAVKCNCDPSTVHFHWSMDVGERFVNASPRKEHPKAEEVAERREIVDRLMEERRCTAHEICQVLCTEHNIFVDTRTVSSDLNALGWVRMKPPLP